MSVYIFLIDFNENVLKLILLTNHRIMMTLLKDDYVLKQK